MSRPPAAISTSSASDAVRHDLGLPPVPLRHLRVKLGTPHSRVRSGWGVPVRIPLEPIRSPGFQGEVTRPVVDWPSGAKMSAPAIVLNSGRAVRPSAMHPAPTPRRRAPAARSLTRARPPISGTRRSASSVERRASNVASSAGSRNSPAVSAKITRLDAPSAAAISAARRAHAPTRFGTTTSGLAFADQRLCCVSGARGRCTLRSADSWVNQPRSPRDGRSAV